MAKAAENIVGQVVDGIFSEIKLSKKLEDSIISLEFRVSSIQSFLNDHPRRKQESAGVRELRNQLEKVAKKGDAVVKDYHLLKPDDQINFFQSMIAFFAQICSRHELTDQIRSINTMLADINQNNVYNKDLDNFFAPSSSSAGLDLHESQTEPTRPKLALNESLIDAAFRASEPKLAYMFKKKEYMVLDYAPGGSNDTVEHGPELISDGFPSLKGTAFADHGIDCAFGSASNEEEAFIFSGNLCALITYCFPPGTASTDRIKKGPMTIAEMFPFFKGTAFESGVDAAFDSPVVPQAYLFKGKECALVNYDPDDCSLVGGIRPITEAFPSLKGTAFASGIHAAFTVHGYDDHWAYVFKRDSYAWLSFASPPSEEKVSEKGFAYHWPGIAQSGLGSYCTES